MLKYVYLIIASYYIYVYDILNGIVFLILTCISLLLEIKDLLTKKEKENGNN
jgi:hypothetical protein